MRLGAKKIENDLGKSLPRWVAGKNRRKRRKGRQMPNDTGRRSISVVFYPFEGVGSDGAGEGKGSHVP